MNKAYLKTLLRLSAAGRDRDGNVVKRKKTVAPRKKRSRG